VFHPYLARILVITAAIFLTSTLDVLSIGMIVPVVSIMIAPEESSSTWIADVVQNITNRANLSSNYQVVVFTGLAVIVILVIIKNLILLLQNLLVHRLATNVELHFKVKLFNTFMCARYEEITSRGRGVIIEDLSRAATGIVSSISVAASLLNGVMLTVTSIVLLFYLSWWSIPIIGLPLLLVYGITGPRLQRRSAQIGSELHDIRQKNSVAMVDFLDGIRVIKANVMENVAVSRIRTLLQEYLPLYVVSRLLPSIPGAIIEIIGAFLITILVVIAVTRPVLGLTLSEIAAIVVLMRRLLPTVSSIQHGIVNLSDKLRVVEIADETLSNLPIEKTGGHVLEDDYCIEKIDLQDLSFSYHSRPDVSVLDDINITLQRGQVTAFVGQTGSGKSTIADLLIRLYDPDAGKILVDEVNLSNIDLYSYRKRIGFVGQDPYLFNTTLRNNITLWDSSIKEDDLDQTIKTVQLDELLNSMNEGYETVVGDRGLRLSGGQRQRVAIARAILTKPNVLVFDEATSALDNLTESEVHAAISKLREKSIVLVIAHRLTTVRDADMVVVLDRGRIVEQGHPDQLLLTKGQFYRLYENDAEHSKV
jgi:ABC-type multidrug transport system fused ATPase/permease subunit